LWLFVEFVGGHASIARKTIFSKIRGFFQVLGDFYLTVKGLIKINNIATAETVPLDEMP